MKRLSIQANSKEYLQIDKRIKELEEERHEVINGRYSYLVDIADKVRQLDYLIAINKKMIGRKR